MNFAMGGFDFGLKNLIVVSGVLRVLLILYGEWQDAHMEVRYTDVDYFVFSDAAKLVASGRSPFERSTYRYSPLLAILLVPNSLVHRSWGKFLFSSADLSVGFFIHVILRKRGVPEISCLYSVSAWLFNPFTFTIGTRGNCEPIVCAMILWIIISIMNGMVIFYRQHFAWFEAHLAEIQLQNDQFFIVLLEKHPDQGKGYIWITIRLLVQTVLVSCFFQDLQFCFFVQTVAFVSFNKVITAQYFVWFFCLLPLILPWSKMKLKWHGAVCIIVWMVAELHWLFWGYLLEFKGSDDE